jgi:hypothetical protein
VFSQLKRWIEASFDTVPHHLDFAAAPRL